jgi:cephalosporin-C deacetylase
MDMAKDAYNELRDYFRHANPLHVNEAAVFEKLGYIDIQHLAPRIKAEVLWSIGLMDTICPPSSQFAAYNKIASKKKMDIYPDYVHEHIKGANDRIFGFLSEL